MRCDLLGFDAAGNATMAVYRLVRSTSVATTEGRAPITRSPSQWPGTLRSSTSAGRALMDTMPQITPRPVRRRATLIDYSQAADFTHPPWSGLLALPPGLRPPSGTGVSDLP